MPYVSQRHDHASAMLEFEADLDDVYIQGVDILRRDGEGKLVSFTVMVHPIRGLQKLAELTAPQLPPASPDAPALACREATARQVHHRSAA